MRGGRIRVHELESPQVMHDQAAIVSSSHQPHAIMSRRDASNRARRIHCRVPHRTARLRGCRSILAKLIGTHPRVKPAVARRVLRPSVNSIRLGGCCRVGTQLMFPSCHKASDSAISCRVTWKGFIIAASSTSCCTTGARPARITWPARRCCRRSRCCCGYILGQRRDCTAVTKGTIHGRKPPS